MTAADLAARLEARRNGDGWQATCPAHDDRTPSLSIREGTDGRVLVHCHAGCAFDAIVASLGVETRDLFADIETNRGIIAEYDYTDADGTLLYQVVRFAPKDFRQRRPDGAGGWIWNLKGTRRVLYHLPQLLAAIAAGHRVFVCEGEKDVHAIEAHGFAATTNPGGAQKWRPEYSDVLMGADVVIAVDRDEAGFAHGRQVVAALEGIARRVVTVMPVAGKDVADHLAAGHTLAELEPLEGDGGDGDPDVHGDDRRVGLDHDVPPPPAPEDAEATDRGESLRAPRKRDTAQAFDPPLLAAFAAENPTAVCWTADGYVARGNVTVVAGYPKSGKTTFLAELVGAVSASANFLGKPTEPGAVLWIDLEQPKGLTTRALSEHCLAEAPVYVQWGRLPDLQVAAEWCRQHQVVVVVLDSLSKVWKVFGVEDENDPVQVEQAMQPLLDFARAANVALVIVHHLRKSGGSEGLDVRGSGHIAAVVDILVSFRRFSADPEGGDTRRVLEAYSRYEETPAKLVIERVDRRYRVCGTPGEVRRRGERDKVLAVLTADPQTAEALAPLAALSESATRTVLKQLTGDHTIERTGTGKKGDPFQYSKMLMRIENPIVRAIISEPESDAQEPGT